MDRDFGVAAPPQDVVSSVDRLTGLNDQGRHFRHESATSGNRLGGEIDARTWLPPGREPGPNDDLDERQFHQMVAGSVRDVKTVTVREPAFGLHFGPDFVRRTARVEKRGVNVVELGARIVLA